MIPITLEVTMKAVEIYITKLYVVTENTVHSLNKLHIDKIKKRNKIN